MAYRWALIALSGLLALLVPRFGAYLALIGALANALLIYVLPHWCWLRVVAPRARRTPTHYCSAAFSAANIVFGLVVAGYGTYQSIQGLLAPAGSTNNTSAAWH